MSHSVIPPGPGSEYDWLFLTPMRISVGVIGMLNIIILLIRVQFGMYYVVLWQILPVLT